MLLLCGCAPITAPEGTTGNQVDFTPVSDQTQEIPYESRFDTQTQITLNGDAVDVSGDGVSLSKDIEYYQDLTAYESGNPYGEGEQWERHTQEEAAAHLVVNIKKPGAYLVKGTLTKGQIRVDLGEDAYGDSAQVVELILEDASITCTVGPAVLFRNVYECDTDWSVETAKPQVDTTNAGANLILRGANVVNGSHVAKIFKDQQEEKKLLKQDGAIYSYMSMNVFGPGSLDLTADNEGLDTELHLTINGGQIAICSQNDGINTNEDGVSVTTIQAGDVHIIAGLGQEGDGIDSNGYLVINGGTVVSSANPAADAGLDSDLGSYIHGGYVIALGSTMDWAETDSEQVTMNLQMASYQPSDSAVMVTDQNGLVRFAYDPSEDEVLKGNQRKYMGAVISTPNFRVGDIYRVYLDGTVTGAEVGGMYDVTTVTAYNDGTQMAYTGTDVRRGPGGMGGFKLDFDGQMSQRPGEGQPPEGIEFSEGMEPLEGMSPPDGMEFPEGMTPPDGFTPGQMPGQADETEKTGAPNSEFYMQDKVNFFSGLTPVQ